MPASREAVTVLPTAALSLTFLNFAATGRPSWLITPAGPGRLGRGGGMVAAAIAGWTVLGYMSLRSRTVWRGAGLRIAVAMIMDLSAPARGGLLR